MTARANDALEALGAELFDWSNSELAAAGAGAANNAHLKRMEEDADEARSALERAAGAAPAVQAAALAAGSALKSVLCRARPLFEDLAAISKQGGSRTAARTAAASAIESRPLKDWAAAAAAKLAALRQVVPAASEDEEDEEEAEAAAPSPKRARGAAEAAADFEATVGAEDAGRVAGEEAFAGDLAALQAAWAKLQSIKRVADEREAQAASLRAALKRREAREAAGEAAAPAAAATKAAAAAGK